MQVKDACRNYQSYVGYVRDLKQFLLHDLSHLLAAGLTDPDHLLDYDYVKKNILANRIAGYESEPIVAIYDYYLRNYPRDLAHKDSADVQKMLSDIMQKIEKTNNYNFEQDLKDRTRNINNMQKDDLSYWQGTEKHRKMRIKYATGAIKIINPENDEMLYHAHAAKDFCDKFKDMHGFYPSSVAPDFLLDMDISSVFYKHEYPEGLLEKVKERNNNHNVVCR